MMNLDVYHTSRATTDLLDLISDIGGVLQILTELFKYLATPFAMVQLQSLISNKLFYLSSQTVEELILNIGDHKPDWTKIEAHRLERNNLGQLKINIPKFLPLHYLKWKVLQAICQQNKSNFGAYQHLIKRGYSDFIRDTDIIRLVRRLRMHGVGLKY